ncbi:MAG: sigma-54-dependent Fis family transcriptional regulator [Fibrobacteres bacterium]|nr:sigma-54-dependent Fis family transcriptional regulator [Fibrobacterota bacterium]
MKYSVVFCPLYTYISCMGKPDEKTFTLTAATITALSLGKSLVITCNSTGRILNKPESKTFYQQFENSHPFISMIESGTISEYFDLNNYGGLFMIAEKNLSISNKPMTLLFDELGRFYTSLPLLTMQSYKIDDDAFIVTIKVSYLLPNYHTGSSTSIFVVDRSERVVGFNQSFCRYFAKEYTNPETILNQHIDNFLTPGPLSIQKSILAKYKPDANQFNETIFAWDFGEQAGLPKEIDIFGTANHFFERDGLRWKNNSGELSLLRISIPIEITENDFTVEFDGSVKTGHAPLFALTFNEKSRMSPTESSYLVGRYGSGPYNIIKKDGYILQAEPEQPQENSTTHRNTLYRIGQSFYWYRNDIQQIAFFDSDLPHGKNGYISLAIRNECEFILRKLNIRIKPRSGSDSGEALKNSFVKLKTAEQETFLINRNINSASSSLPITSYSFIMQDISALQNQIDSLNERYNRQLQHGRKLESMLRNLSSEPENTFIGASAAVTLLKEKARMAADSNVTILIQGQTGTGKEVMASFIHANSPFRNGPLVKVDCSTLPRELMESELFGHEKGSFTGASGRKIGKLEQADGGTLFLDEAGNLSPETQAKLLQFMQDFTITRVGGSKKMHLKLRVIAATNIPLENLVRTGSFREDLYFRLFVVVLNIPTLAERKEDIAMLSSHFIHQMSVSSGKNIRGLTEGAYRKLYEYNWPGNIRELRNVLQRAVLFCSGTEITEDLITVASQTQADQKEYILPKDNTELVSQNSTANSREHVLSKMEPEQIHGILRRHRGRVAKIAQELGVTNRAVYFYIKRNNLDLSAYKKLNSL